MIPEGYNDLVYNGEEQQGIWESEEYSVLSGGSSTEAGIHEATVRLADKKNTVWEDGSTGDKKVKWTIAGDGNEWTEGFSCPDITYGETPEPSAKAKYGKVEYTYSKDAYEAFTSKVPTEAGTYFVRARVKETEEYAGLENVMEFTIKKAVYDMADVSFEDCSVSYDGRLKNITVKGSLPEGLTVSYEGNGKVNAGSYEIKAAFAGDNNHEPVPEKKATLTILPRQAEQVTSGPIPDRTYSGRPQEPEPDLESDYIPLAKGLDYEVEYKDNKDTGTAKAIVTFKGNYEGRMEIPFTIRQAKNRWKTGLACQDIPYGSRPQPEAEARFGRVSYLYSDQEDGNYTEKVPGKFGIWYVKALVEGTDNYTGLESEPVAFTIQAHEHSWDNGKTTKEPTCTETGTMTFTCKDCGDTRTETIAATGHKPVIDPAVAATKEATGLTEGSHCSVCGTVLKKQTVIPKLASEDTAEKESSHETPVDVVVEDKKPADSSSSSVSAARQEKAITSQKGDGDPKGSTYGILSARVKKSTKNAQTLSWNKVKGASGYLVYGNQCGTKYRFKKLAEIKKTSWTHKKLKKGTYYKYIVVAYKTVSGNKTVSATSRTLHSATAGGKAGNPKAVRVNKASITLKRNKIFVIKGKEIPASKKGKIKRHRKICFESDNPKVATVSSSGKVKGLKKGSCRIYVHAQNGVSKVVKVHVK